MSSLVVIDRLGQEHVLEADSGRTVMEVIRDGGLDELLALCGGCLSCATCHVHVDPDFLGATTKTTCSIHPTTATNARAYRANWR